ncbi:MAG: FTR1 family protein [Myxococcaceae bacterium]
MTLTFILNLSGSVIRSALALGFLCVSAWAAPFSDAGTPPDKEAETEAWHRLVSVLQYLEVDYPAAHASHDAFELAEQKAFAEAAHTQAVTLGPPAAPILPRLLALAEAVSKQADPAQVRVEASALATWASERGHLLRAPRSTPSLKLGASLFSARCASCHGARGNADSALAKTLKPAPVDFLSRGAAETLTPYRVFNTVRFGIAGTAMAPYPELTESERWALGFFVLSLRHPKCEGGAPRVALDELANSTDAQLASRYGASPTACLRGRPPEDAKPHGFALARQGVEEARRFALEGQPDKARDALVDTYLNAVEPLEPALRARAPAQVQAIEAGFLAARSAADNPQAFDREARRLLELLVDPAQRSATSSRTVFWLALLILLREGFEAMIVVGALLAVLKKLGQDVHARWVHAGWVSALVAGAGLYFFGRGALAGAQREWLEGLVALAASGMLLYAALWLNARSQMSHFMTELREKMQGALGRGSTLGLFFISFSAVFRETFETALFLQGLSIDSPQGAAWGALAGLAVLLGLVLLIRRIGFRLPMKPMFRASTVLLYVMAVILLGKGLRALQEVGAIGLLPIPFVHIDVLGIYPDAVTLLPQLLLAFAPFAYRWRKQS